MGDVNVSLTLEIEGDNARLKSFNGRPLARWTTDPGVNPHMVVGLLLDGRYMGNVIGSEVDAQKVVDALNAAGVTRR